MPPRIYFYRDEKGNMKKFSYCCICGAGPFKESERNYKFVGTQGRGTSSYCLYCIKTLNIEVEDLRDKSTITNKEKIEIISFDDEKLNLKKEIEEKSSILNLLEEQIDREFTTEKEEELIEVDVETDTPEESIWEKSIKNKREELEEDAEEKEEIPQDESIEEGAEEEEISQDESIEEGAKEEEIPQDESIEEGAEEKEEILQDESIEEGAEEEEEILQDESIEEGAEEEEILQDEPIEEGEEILQDKSLEEGAEEEEIPQDESLEEGAEEEEIPQDEFLEDNGEEDIPTNKSFENHREEEPIIKYYSIPINLQEQQEIRCPFSVIMTEQFKKNLEIFKKMHNNIDHLYYVYIGQYYDGKYIVEITENINTNLVSHNVNNTENNNLPLEIIYYHTETNYYQAYLSKEAISLMTGEQKEELVEAFTNIFF